MDKTFSHFKVKHVCNKVIFVGSFQQLFCTRFYPAPTDVNNDYYLFQRSPKTNFWALHGRTRVNIYYPVMLQLRSSQHSFTSSYIPAFLCSTPRLSSIHPFPLSILSAWSSRVLKFKFLNIMYLAKVVFFFRNDTTVAFCVVMSSLSDKSYKVMRF